MPRRGLCWLGVAACNLSTRVVCRRGVLNLTHVLQLPAPHGLIYALGPYMPSNGSVVGIRDAHAWSRVLPNHVTAPVV